MYNGLKVTIFDGLFNETRKDQMYQVVSNGLQVIIYNQSISPSMNEGLLAAPGFSTYFRINKVLISKQTLPYNDCIDKLDTYHLFNSSLYSEIVSSNISYRQSDCLDFAFLKTLWPQVSFNDRYKFLQNVSKIFLANSFYDFYNNMSNTNTPRCPFECNSVSYEITTFQSDYPSYNEYLTLLNNTELISNFPNGNLTSVQEFKQSLYTIYIFFNQLSYTEINQQPEIDLWNLISNIGGLFGLFLGLSFLSFVDLIQTLFEVLFILFERTKIKPRKDKNNFQSIPSLVVVQQRQDNIF